MDILFINPDYNDKMNYPWGVLNLASYLRGVKGYSVELIDASVLGEKAALERLNERLPATSLLGIGFMSIDSPFAKKVADLVKASRPGIFIVAGGPHPTLVPEQTALYPNFDAIAYGEAEITVERLIEELRRPKPDLAAVPGLVYRQDGELVKTAPAPPAPFYDIDYSLLEPSVQQTFETYMQVFTGFGCSFKCTFCFNAICGSAWRGRPMEEVFRELEGLVRRFDPKTIYFRDENFFHDRKRVLEFIELYHRYGFRFKWRALCRASYFNDKYMNADFLRELAGAGCNCLKYGFESGSDRVLRSIRKGILVRNIERVYQAHQQVPEIKLVGNFMMGMPGEEADDYKATLNLIGKGLRMVPDMEVVGPHYFRIYPGGELYNKLIADFGFRAPQSFEEWAERYQNDEARGVQGGFADTHIRYPWISSRSEFLTRNASHLIRLARPDYIDGQPPYKRWLFRPLHALLRWRLTKGWYDYLIDLRLAMALQSASVQGLLQNMPLYGRLRRTALYQRLRKFPAFAQFRSFFQKASSSAK